MDNLKFIIKAFTIYFALSLACFLMLRSIIGYTSFEDNVQFLRRKQDYIHNPVWMVAFYIHVFSSILVLFAGFTQFSSELMQEYRKLHRAMGKIYVLNILLINAPVGMIMAVYANGGWMGKTAFILLDILWFFFTYQALVSAKNRKFIDHQNYMIYSYALTLSAITLRSWITILPRIFTVDYDQLYIIVAWMGFVPNLLMARWIIWRKRI